MTDRFQASLVIPCFNEERQIGDTLRTVATFIGDRGLPWQVVPVDDGSTDATKDLLLQAAKDHPFVRPVLLPANRGKGGALAQGVRDCSSGAVVFFDADLSYPLEAIEPALAALRDGADLVIGARDLVPAASPNHPRQWVRRLTSAGFSALVDHYLHLGIPDTQCGFKAFKGPVARALFACLTVERFAFDVELLALARRWNLAIHRMPVTPIQRATSSVRLVKDSLEMWRALARVRRRLDQGAYPATMPSEPP